MARLETAVLAASETYTRNHAAQSERVETLRARIAEATAGGRPDMVQAGGTQPENLPGALMRVSEWVGERL